MKHTTEKRGAGTTEKRPSHTSGAGKHLSQAGITEKRPSHTSGAGKHLSQATRGTIRPPSTR
jgi:hypothetical protein